MQGEIAQLWHTSIDFRAVFENTGPFPQCHVVWVVVHGGDHVAIEGGVVVGANVEFGDGVGGDGFFVIVRAIGGPWRVPDDMEGGWLGGGRVEGEEEDPDSEDHDR